MHTKQQNDRKFERFENPLNFFGQDLGRKIEDLVHHSYNRCPGSRANLACAESRFVWYTLVCFAIKIQYSMYLHSLEIKP